jgi:hypothetical protein
MVEKAVLASKQLVWSDKNLFLKILVKCKGGTTGNF